MRQARRAAPIPPLPRQLPLPLAPPRPSPPPVLPAMVATLRAEQIWRSLATTTRAQVRRALCAILQEVIEHDHG